MLNSKAKWQIASSVRVIPYMDGRPDEDFYLVVNVANKRWLKITTQAYEFLLECSADCPLAEVIAEASQRFEIEEKELVALRDEFVRQGFLIRPGQEQQEVNASNCAVDNRGAVVYLNVTERCNLKCPYCYFNAGPGGKDPLSASEINRITDNLAANGVTEVVISGGEPLIRRDIFKILEHARSQFEKIYLLTNGVFLAKYELCKRLVGLVDRVQVSVDGSRPEVHECIRGKGTFTPTIQALKNLKEAGVPKVTISMTLTKLNAHDALNVMELASDLEVRFDFNRSTPIGRGRHRDDLSLTPQEVLDVFKAVQEQALKAGHIRLDPLYRQLGRPIRLKCGAGTTSSFSIAPDGSVYPCHVLHQPQFYIGNALYESDLRSMIGNSPVAQRLRELEVDSRPKCKECFVRYFCGGGCPANSYAAHGDIQALDPFCPFYSKFETAIITGWRYDLPPVANVKRVIERLQ